MGTGASVGGSGQPGTEATNGTGTTESTATANAFSRKYTFAFKLDGAVHTVAVQTGDAASWLVWLNGKQIESESSESLRAAEIEGEVSVSSTTLHFKIPNSSHSLYVYEQANGALKGRPVLRIDNKVSGYVCVVRSLAIDTLRNDALPPVVCCL